MESKSKRTPKRHQRNDRKVQQWKVENQIEQ